MINTILFDLDGTLLQMDSDQFMKLYFYNMGKHFSGWTDPNKLAKNIMEATEVMIKTKDNRTNEEIFMDHFATLVDRDINEYKNHFNIYYDTLFANVKASTHVSTEMLEAIKILQQKGYNLVIATNPLFPYKANLHRIEWAGLKPEWFQYISSFEENKYTKPHLEYYREVLDNINKNPEDCLMVGNDVSDDLPAGKLGIKTFLVTDCLLNDKNLEVNSDYSGNYKDFLQFVKELPNIQ